MRIPYDIEIHEVDSKDITHSEVPETLAGVPVIEFATPQGISGRAFFYPGHYESSYDIVSAVPCDDTDEQFVATGTMIGEFNIVGHIEQFVVNEDGLVAFCVVDCKGFTFDVFELSEHAGPFGEVGSCVDLCIKNFALWWGLV
jgi:hypothetical protein